MARGKRQRIPAIVATDTTFEPAELRGARVWTARELVERLLARRRDRWREEP